MPGARYQPAIIVPCVWLRCAFGEMGFSATVCKKEKSGDVYFDYTTLMVDFCLDSTKIEWSLDNSATWADYLSWEKDMDHGFDRCRTLNCTFGGRVEYVLAHRRVDEKVATWWRKERSAKGMIGGTSSSEEFKQFLRARFLEVHGVGHGDYS
jgi:hypothetical protein